MKTILITGTGGFLGSRLLRRFSLKDAAAAALPVRLSSPEYRLRGISGRTPDICDAAALLSLLDQVRPDYVIHCAAVSDTGRCEREPELSWAVNVDGAENVAAACAAVGAKMIFCSSDQVYFDIGQPGAADLAPHRESGELRPAGVYGRQKLEAEARCAAACPGTVSLRLSWMYDTGAPGPEKHGNLITTLRALRDNPDPEARLAFPVHDHRSITNVWDVAANMEAALDLAPGVYNFGSPNRWNAYETAAGFLRILSQRPDGTGGPPDPRLIPDYQRFSACPRNLQMNMEKTAAAGISFPTAEEGLIRALCRSHP